MRPEARANGTTIPSETPMTASFTLLGLGLKLRRRWNSVIDWGGRGVGFSKDEVVVVVEGAERVWDSNSTVAAQGFMALFLFGV